MPEIHHSLLINAPAEKVYKAITTQEGLSAWWTPETSATPETGTVARFAFGPDYFKEMKIVELVPSSSVKWLCLAAYAEWIGTTISFELKPVERGTQLSFSHVGWKACTAEFCGCSYDWALFLRSLRLLCETGEGRPYPNYK